MLAGHCLTALSRPATRIWEGWTTARAVIEQLRAIGPVMATEINRYRRAEDRELLLSGLGLAVGEAK